MFLYLSFGDKRVAVNNTVSQWFLVIIQKVHFAQVSFNTDKKRSEYKRAREERLKFSNYARKCIW